MDARLDPANMRTWRKATRMLFVTQAAVHPTMQFVRSLSLTSCSAKRQGREKRNGVAWAPALLEQKMSTATMVHSDPFSEINHGVYVIEFSGSQTFAFEARSAADAEEIARAGWFTQALDRFCSKGLRQKSMDNFLRPATDHEAVAFREQAEEFAGETVGTLLMVRFSPEKHGP
jgi:hypothetical protein